MPALFGSTVAPAICGTADGIDECGLAKRFHLYDDTYLVDYEYLGRQSFVEQESLS